MACKAHISTIKPTHKTPSGLGGSFDVILVKTAEDLGDRVQVRVVMPGGDFHGWQFRPLKSDVHPL